MKHRKEPWRANEMHYCEVCKVWLQSDKQSILLHENGKKHREAVENAMKKRREDKIKQEKESKAFQASLRKMEAAAAQAMSRDVDAGYVSLYQGGMGVGGTGGMSQGMGSGVGGATLNHPGKSIKTEIKSWKEKKHQREVQKQNDSKDASKDDTLHTSTTTTESTQKKRKLGPDEGHYTINEKTYLEGQTYASILEEEMPVQLWTGSSTMSNDYRKSKESSSLWKNGIILKVTKRVQSTSNSTNEKNDTMSNDGNDESVNITCIIAYLKDVQDEDETIQKNVPPEHIRLVIGSDDEYIPNTVEEARLLLLGGEEVIESNEPNDATAAIAQEPTIDENTGLSSWGTVTVRKISVNHELKQERERLRQKRREEAEKERLKEKELEQRKMEESKHEGAHDSALGAYDVWSTSGKMGYKGVKIYDANTLEDGNKAVDEASISAGVDSGAKGQSNVKFKKRVGDKKQSFKAKKRKQNRRITFTESDDDE